MVARKSEIPEQNIRIYKDALKVAFSDGSLSDDGELMLKSLASRYEIDDELHEELQLEVFIYLAELHKNEGDYEEALKWFKVLTDIDEDDEYAWRQMGIIHTEDNEYQLAGRTLKRAHQISERARKDLKYAEKVEKKAEYYKRLTVEREETVKKRGKKKKKGRGKKKKPVVEIIEEIPELIEDPDIEMEDSFEVIEDETPPPMEFEFSEESEVEMEEVVGEPDWGDDEEEEDVVEEVEEEEEEEVEEERPRRRRGERRSRREPEPPEEDEEEEEEEKPRRRSDERRRRREPEPKEDRRERRKPRENKEKKDKPDTMKCPKCRSTVIIPSKKRPVVVKCPDCGASGKLLK